MCFVSVFSYAQEVTLINPSFEGIPRASSIPEGWKSCDDADQSPADTEPSPAFEVTKKASDGDTYLGLVTRYHGTTEGVSQELLGKILHKDTTYCMDIDMYCSNEKRAFNPRDLRYRNTKAPYTNPTRLRIWGGNDICDPKELLYESELIENRKWKTYSFTFKPRGDYRFISLEATFDVIDEYYNGNLMIDDIELRSCEGFAK